MTVAHHGGNLPAVQGNIEDETGLGDFDDTDLTVPRLVIEHKEGKFKDSLSGEIFDDLEIVILGLVKQRIMWNTVMGDKDNPMCKSTDFNLGFPTLEGNNGKTFPWKQSNFTKETLAIDPVINGVKVDTNGHAALPCAACKFKEWDTHPLGNKPYCGELWVFPVMYRKPLGANGTEEERIWTLAILTIKSSGIGPAKKYLSSFKRSNQAAFTAITRFTLQVLTKGETIYSVPVMKRVGDTERSDWNEFAESFRAVRDYLRKPPRLNDNSDDSPEVASEQLGVNAWNQPAVQAVSAEYVQPQYSQPVSTPVPEAVVVAAEPSPVATPVREPVTAPMVVAVAPVPQPPAAPTPVAAPVAPAPVATPAPVAAEPVGDPDDLPF